MTADATSPDRPHVTERRLRTPHAAAAAGIVFAVITLVAMTMIHTALPADPPTDAGWLTEDENQVAAAVTLVPFAAIAFLWFIGVLRDLLGQREDQFFATIFLGSGLLFLGGLFVWTATIAAALASSNAQPDVFAKSPAYTFAGSLIEVMDTVVTLRMAGVFMFSTATMWLRTGAMPRWLVLLTFAGAIVLLIGGPGLRGVRLSFPAWVLIVSIMILVRHRRNEGSARFERA
ncbi:MAG: hypothetical protein ACR2OH_09680 [Microthrixaceae bacterium]